jgi:hypothetical protein
MAKQSQLFNDFDTPNGSYNLFQNAMRKAIDYDANISDIFEAKVLTRPTLVTKQPGSVRFKVAEEGKTETFAFMARILGTNSPHRFLEDPCKIEDTENAESRSQMHTKVFMQTNSQSPLPEIGDVVKLKLERGSYGSFKTDRAEFVKEESKGKEDNKLKEQCVKVASKFETGDFQIRPLDSYARIIPPSKQAIDNFLIKLKGSGHFTDFSDNFLWGLTANAIAESALDPEASGDPESQIGRRAFKPINGKCSYGYWQLNICSGDGEGTQFINKKRLSRKEEEKVLNTILNETNQFEYVAARMKQIFPNDWNSQDITPFDAAKIITINFEKPQNKEDKAIQRGNLAEEIAGNN